MQDRLHQSYREGLLPFSQGLLTVMREAGASGACWSGSGSTMLALVGEEAVAQVEQAANSFFHDEGLAGEVRVLEVDRIGAVVR
jgi:homoserine kinase